MEPTKIVCCHHDTVLVLDSQNTRPRYDRLPCKIIQLVRSPIAYAYSLCTLHSSRKSVLGVIVWPLGDWISPIRVVCVIALGNLSISI